jgi:hypothetical protein
VASVSLPAGLICKRFAVELGRYADPNQKKITGFTVGYRVKGPRGRLH